MPPFSLVAGQFKKAFEDARDNNAKLAGAPSTAPSTAPPPYTREEKHEETTESEGEDEDEAKGNAPAPSETNPPAGAPQDSEDKTGEE